MRFSIAMSVFMLVGLIITVWRDDPTGTSAIYVFTPAMASYVDASADLAAHPGQALPTTEAKPSVNCAASQRVVLNGKQKAGDLQPPADVASKETNSVEDKLGASGTPYGSEELGREIQRELARLGCFSGDVNASWGRESRAAIKLLGKATHSAWPDWPSSELVRSLWSYPDGHCLKCETCTTVSTTPEMPLGTVSGAKPPVEARTASEPVTASAGEMSMAIPAEDHNSGHLRGGARFVPDGPDDLPPAKEARTAPVAEEELQPSVSMPAKNPSLPAKVGDSPRPWPKPKRTQPPKKVALAAPVLVKKDEAVPSPQPSHAQPSGRDGVSGSPGWPNGGPANSVGR